MSAMSAGRRRSSRRCSPTSASRSPSSSRSALTGSSSMLAESIHSVADSGNQVLLLLGGKRAKRAATPRAPLRVRPGALHLRVHRVHRAVQRRWPVRAVRGVPQVAATRSRSTAGTGCRSSCWSSAIVLESFSFRTAIQESNKVRGDASWAQFIRHSRVPELPVILLEDLGALIGLVFALFGVGLTLITDDGIWDAIGTAAIGVLLVAVAVVLAIETKSLLLGEGATPEQRGRDRAGDHRRRRGRADHPHADRSTSDRRSCWSPRRSRCTHDDTRDGRRPRHRRGRGPDPRGGADRPGHLPGAGHLPHTDRRRGPGGC